MFVRIFFLLCLTFVSTIYVNTFAADEVWYVSSLNSEMYGKNIHIVNESNEEVPYVLFQQIISTSTSVANEPMQIVENTMQKYEGNIDRVVVLDSGKEGQTYTGLVIQPTPESKNFNKVARIFISDSLLSASSPAWKEIEKRTIVYSYTGQGGLTVSNFKIHFPDLTSRYIKVQFEENARESLPINISGAQIEYDVEEEIPSIKKYISGDFDLSKEVITKNVEFEDNILKDVRSVAGITLQVDKNISSFAELVTVESSQDCVIWNNISTSTVYRINSPVSVIENLTVTIPPTTATCVRVLTTLSIEKKAQITEQEVGVLFKVDPVDIEGLRVRIDNSGLATSSYILQKDLNKVGNIVPEVVQVKNYIDGVSEKEAKNPYVLYSAIFLIAAILAYLRYKATRKA